MKRFIRTMAVAAVLVIAIVLATGAASAQLFPPGPGPMTPGPGPMTPGPGPMTPQGPGPMTPGPGPAGATAITSGPGDNLFPAISGNTIVWFDNTTMSVRVYDAASGRSLTIPGNNTYALVSMRQADVSEDYVVWAGMSAATMTSDIYLYDIASGSVTPLTSGQGYQMFPAVMDNLIFWDQIDTATGKGEIYWYNVANGHTGSLLENSSINQLFPAAGGGFIAWLDNGKVSDRLDLHWLSLESGKTTRLISTRNITSPPAVSSDGRWIAWIAVDSGENAPSVRMLDTGTGKTQGVTGQEAMPAPAVPPAVDGNYVVWTDYRNGNGDIYLYDIQSGQERQITSDRDDEGFPDISNGRIVWMGNNDGYWNIYSAIAGGGAQPTSTPISTPTRGARSAPASIDVKSSAFANGTSIPARYTCDGDDISPPLSWRGVPEGTKSLALIMDDPDASGFTHWVIYNIPPTETGLAEGVPGMRDLPGGMHQGKNDFGTNGYGGPCPPKGPSHHYVFRLYALSGTPNLPATVDQTTLEAGMRDYIIAEGVLVGTYGR